MVKIYYELDLYYFQAWSGGKDRLDKIKELGKIEELEQLINDIFCDDSISETELNDFLWFDLDNYIEDLGITDEEWNS